MLEIFYIMPTFDSGIFLKVNCNVEFETIAINISYSVILTFIGLVLYFEWVFYPCMIL